MTGEFEPRRTHAGDANLTPERETARSVTDRVAHARATDAETDASLRKLLGYGATALMAAQIAAADVVFVLYASNNDWEIPAAAANVWLAAAVVQVVALAHTVARYLFPAAARGQNG